jgi:hypothetical protein
MPNYANGKIYKIKCNKTGGVYIGCTTCKELSTRLMEHVSKRKRYLKDNSADYIASFKVLEKGDYNIILVESYPCKSKKELHTRECFHIENNECVNINIPIQTKK